jgi:hypothetical protein
MTVVPYDRHGTLDMTQSAFTRYLRDRGYTVTSDWNGKKDLYHILSPKTGEIALRKGRIRRFRHNCNSNWGVVLEYQVGSIYFSPDGLIEYWDA